MNSKEQILLLEEILQRAKEDDLRHKLESYERGDLEQTVGESWMVYHLKLLLNSVIED